MENVIVTGGTGFLGRNMIRRLCAEGYRVYAAVRPESKNIALLPKHENVVPVFCALSELRRELGGRPYDALYHFAWSGVNREQIDDPAVQRQSMESSLNVLEAAAELGCGCFVFAGSRSEYGALREPFRENAACSPQVAYGRAKLEFGTRARAFCRNADLRYIHARIFSVYGADDHPWSLIRTAVGKLLKNEPMELSPCTQLWNFMDVRDMAGLLLTFQRERNRIPEHDGGVFNVATRDIRPLRAFVEEIRRITGSSSELRFGAFRPAAESAISLLPDMTRVETLFGWKQSIPFPDGIRDVIRAVTENDA